MRRKVDHDAMSVVGYTAPWSVSAGTTIDLHLSTGKPIKSVTIERLDLPGEQSKDWLVEKTGTPAAHEDFDRGSYLFVAAEEIAKVAPIVGVSFELYLTRNRGVRTILSSGEFCLRLVEGTFVVECSGNIVSRSEPVPAKTWLSLRVSHGVSGMQILAESADRLSPWAIQVNIDVDHAAPFGKQIVFGSDLSKDSETLNGKFSNIVMETAHGRVSWQFPTLLPSGPIASIDSSEPVFLDFKNQPTFCTTSMRWDGSSFDPRFVPDQYDAIHCHDDDMSALQWPASYRLNVPCDAEAGIYAFRVEYDGGYEKIVFFISSSQVRAPLLFLVPTATYLAYSDEYLPENLYPPKCEDRGHEFAVANQLRSLYDYHNDASGVSICSYRKPKVTIRDDYNYPLCGCPHNLPVDLHFLRFLHRNNVAFDLITDHDLHERGADALEGYEAVMTGSHPEYMTDRMESSLRQFVIDGGNLAYLGGNGFAAGVAFRDDLMELRRSAIEAGRTWDGPIAELTLSITNEPGGYFRHRARGEFSLVGGAISLMGFHTALPYTRTDESYAPETGWLFDGVLDATFGDQGIVLGGAAGYEVDATDPHLGTSPETVVVARATGFPESFFHDATRWYEGGDEELERRRCAEMTLRPLSNGAYIFSVGSVAWLGALPADNTMNDVGRLTLNLLDEFTISRARENSRMAVL